jgi:hypothetical protein
VARKGSFVRRQPTGGTGLLKTSDISPVTPPPIKPPFVPGTPDLLNEHHRHHHHGGNILQFDR